jgi:hypothetical protein
MVKNFDGLMPVLPHNRLSGYIPTLRRPWRRPERCRLLPSSPPGVSFLARLRSKPGQPGRTSLHNHYREPKTHDRAT